jgi:hypothetical protein
MEEQDSLKSFLYYFLAIEIETHAAFGSIDHSTSIDRTLSIDDRVRASAKALFERQREHWTNLRDRFVWCAVCLWSQATDTDIQDFVRLKKVRDEIAHGTLHVPPAGAVDQAKRLAIKLFQWGANRGHS